MHPQAHVHALAWSDHQTQVQQNLQTLTEKLAGPDPDLAGWLKRKRGGWEATMKRRGNEQRGKRGRMAIDKLAAAAVQAESSALGYDQRFWLRISWLVQLLIRTFELHKHCHMHDDG